MTADTETRGPARRTAGRPYHPISLVAVIAPVWELYFVSNEPSLHIVIQVAIVTGGCAVTMFRAVVCACAECGL